MVGIFNNNKLRFWGVKEEDASLEDKLFASNLFWVLLSSSSVMWSSEGLEIFSRWGNPVIYSLLFPVSTPKFARAQPGCALVRQDRWIHIHSSVPGSSALQLLLCSAGDSFPWMSWIHLLHGEIWWGPICTNSVTSSFKSVLVSNCPI